MNHFEASAFLNEHKRDVVGARAGERAVQQAMRTQQQQQEEEQTVSSSQHELPSFED